MSRSYCDCRVCMYAERPFEMSKCLHMKSCPTMSHGRPSEEMIAYMQSEEARKNFEAQKQEPLYPVSASPFGAIK